MNNVWIAVFAGFAGTAVMTGLMLMGKRLNLPAVDAHGILGYMQRADRATALGYVMHWILGVRLLWGMHGPLGRWPLTRSWWGRCWGRCIGLWWGGCLRLRRWPMLG